MSYITSSSAAATVFGIPYGYFIILVLFIIFIIFVYIIYLFYKKFKK